jgi:N-methylhydantoinase A
LEVINWRVVASGSRPEWNLKLTGDAAYRTDARKGTRPAYFPEKKGYAETEI